MSTGINEVPKQSGGNETTSITLAANTTMLLQRKIDWYAKTYPIEQYETKFGEPFVTRDGRRAIKATRLINKK